MAKSFDELVRRTATRSTRQKAARRSRELLGELLLSEVRKMTGKSQRELAKVLGIKQPSLSKLEHQDDMQIGTLKRIINALGGEIQVLARFPQGTFRVKQFDRLRKRKASRKHRQIVLA
jgi:transcriptional regulator with XRE-family HTH domain